MQRRGGSGQPVKGQSANRPKASNAPTAQVSTADLKEQLDRRTRERDEALEQQTATSEVLGVISGSPTDVQPVFDLIAKSAARLCQAQFATSFSSTGNSSILSPCRVLRRSGQDLTERLSHGAGARKRGCSLDPRLRR